VPSDESEARAERLEGPVKTISLKALEDKIRGGWAGQMIGVSFGAPTEFRYLARTIPEHELPEWTAEQVAGALRQDDLYVDMTFFSVLDEQGMDASTLAFGDAFRDSQYPLWHANYAARRALRRGVSAELSGTPEVNPHVNDIDFQIEADFIGLLTPGMPNDAVNLAQRVGKVMNGGDGLLGGVFVAGLYSAAFFSNDPREIVEAGLALLPPESAYAEIISDTLSWWSAYPDDWLAAWQAIEEKHARQDICPAGAGAPFNIDAHLNGAYIALGLLYGQGDFERTFKISTMAGQDSDCNPASAAGVLGVVLGYDGIPARYTAGIPAIAQQKFLFTDYSFEEIVARTLVHVQQGVLAAGGRIAGGKVHIPRQESILASVELFGVQQSGRVKERVNPNDNRVHKSEGWSLRTSSRRNTTFEYLTGDQAGITAELSFSGTGIAITAMHQADSGNIRVWLDGRDQGTFDAFSEETDGNPWNNKWGEAVFHRFGLTDGAHTVKLEVLGEPYRRTDPDGSEVVSLGAGISLQDFIVYEGGEQ
jgi:hypothetical protein